MTQRIKITVSYEEQYTYQYNKDSTPEDRTRDVKLYEQIVTRTGEPNDNVNGLIAQIATIVNGISK